MRININLPWIFEVRILLEPEVAAAACENATEEERLHIQRLCDEVEELYLNGENHIQKDMEFHASIAKYSGNRVVEVLVPVIYTAVTTFANLTNRKLMNETKRHIVKLQMQSFVVMLWERNVL